MTLPVYRFGTEGLRDPSADRAQYPGRYASEALAQAWTRPRFEQDDPARRLRMDQRESGPVERERIVGFQEMIVRVPILGNPQSSADAFDARAPGVVEADDLASIELELGAVKADIHGRLFFSGHVLRNAVAEGPVLLLDFDEVDEHALDSNAEFGAEPF